MSRILLADDSKFFRTIERQFLQRTPAVLDEVACSDELFVKLRKECPHLLFVGFTLRPLSGAECCRRIRADPSLRTMPVVIVCDQAQEQQVEESRRAGCDAVLVKPLDRTSFLRAGRRFLNSIREHRQPCFMPVKFSWEGGAFVGKCLDLSGGGLFLESSVNVPVGTILTLEFTLPSGVFVPATCQGEVMWLNRKPNLLKPHYPMGMGVRFNAPSKALSDGMWDPLESTCRHASLSIL